MTVEELVQKCGPVVGGLNVGIVVREGGVREQDGSHTQVPMSRTFTTSTLNLGLRVDESLVGCLFFF